MARAVTWTVISIVVVCLYLLQQISVMSINYQLTALEKNISHVQRENTVMEIALAKDTALEHIDTVAVSRLHMVRPERVEFVVLSGVTR